MTTRAVALDTKWEEFINHVRGGMGGYEAMEHMGHHWRQLTRYLKAHPERREEFEDAKFNSREAPAMRVLMEIMEHGEKDADRISAADKVLGHSRKDKATVVEHRHEHTLNPAQIGSILELQQLAAKRLAGVEPIDVDSTEATKPTGDNSWPNSRSSSPGQLGEPQTDSPPPSSSTTSSDSE